MHKLNNSYLQTFASMPERESSLTAVSCLETGCLPPDDLGNHLAIKSRHNYSQSVAECEKHSVTRQPLFFSLVARCMSFFFFTLSLKVCQHIWGIDQYIVRSCSRGPEQHLKIWKQRSSELVSRVKMYWCCCEPRGKAEEEGCREEMLTGWKSTQTRGDEIHSIHKLFRPVHNL